MAAGMAGCHPAGLLQAGRANLAAEATARPLHNPPFGPISAPGSKWYPRNIQYIPPVTFSAFPEREQK